MAASTQEIFEAAVRVIQTLPKNGSVQPSHQLMLKFYAYYKQATKGPCDFPRPGFWDVVGKAKWDAWNELGDMPREEAMQNYVDSLKKIVEAMPHTDLVQTFVEKLGNFYELVDIPDGKVNGANEWTKQIPIKSLQAVSAGISKTVPQRKAPSEDEEDEEDSSESSPGSSGDADREVADVTAHALLAQANRHDHSLESVGHEYIASQIKMQSTPHDEDSELNTNDHHFSHNHTVNGNGVVMFEDNGLSSGASVSVVSKKIALNGGHRSESESDTEEFCDTSDSLLQEASDEVTLLKKMNSEADAMDDTYADQRAEAAASRHRQDPQYLERELSASDIMRRDESSAALYLSPQQLGDRHWSTNSLPGLGTASEVDLVGLVVQGRGGGGEQDAGASHSLASDPGRARGGGSRRQAPGGADSSQPLPGARGRLLAAGGAGAGGQGSAPPPNRSDMSEQIAVALARLQQDMSSVISRLHTLEALQLAQQQQQPQLGRSRQNSRSSQQGAVSPWWWPFPNFTGRSMFFVLVWPFIVHFIITLIARRNRNRRR